MVSFKLDDVVVSSKSTAADQLLAGVNLVKVSVHNTFIEVEGDRQVSCFSPTVTKQRHRRALTESHLMLGDVYDDLNDASTTMEEEEDNTSSSQSLDTDAECPLSPKDSYYTGGANQHQLPQGNWELSANQFQQEHQEQMYGMFYHQPLDQQNWSSAQCQWTDNYADKSCQWMSPTTDTSSMFSGTQEKQQQSSIGASASSSPPSPAGSKPGFTTIMLRNIPNNYSRAMLLELLDESGYAGTYDFIYLPIDFVKQAGLGYAFVNFTQHEYAKRSFASFDGFRQWLLPSEKVCEVVWSQPHQGLDAHLERFRNSPVMHPSVHDEWRPLLFVNGERVQFPLPTKRIPPPKTRLPLRRR